MSGKLKMADDLALPVQAVTQTFAVFGSRGSGKTTTGTDLVEEVLEAGQPVVVWDPTGAWSGLKSSKDGKSAGYPVVIFGGDHADVPLEETAGDVIAATLVEQRLPAVMDVSRLSKGGRIRLAAQFFETLYHRNREPLLLVIDEAQSVCPQDTVKNVDAGRALGAVEDILLMGRKNGLGLMVISPRPALVNTNVRTGCMTLVLHRTLLPHDRKAIREWTDAHGTPEQAKQMFDDLATLPQGEAWVWSPEWLKIFKRVKFRDRRTFDSSATPEVGRRVVAPKVFAEIDKKALGEQILATVEKKKADDPAALKKKVAELEAKLKTAEARLAATPPPAPAGPDRYEEGVAAGAEAVRKEYDEALQAIADRFKGEIVGLRGKTRGLAPPTKPPAASPKVAAPPELVHHSHKPGKNGQLKVDEKPKARTELVQEGSPKSAEVPSLKVGSGLHKLMVALAQAPGLSDVQLSVRSGIKLSGTFAGYMAAARKVGWIRADEGAKKYLTPEGEAALAAAGPYETLPTGAALFAYWVNKYGGETSQTGPVKVLQAFREAYPSGHKEVALAEATGLKQSGTLSGYLATFRKLSLIVKGPGKNEWSISPELVD